MGAFFLRFDFGGIPDEHIATMWMGLLLIVAIRMVVFLVFSVHRGLYRYSSLYDFVQLFKAVTFGSVLFLAVWYLIIGHSYVMPRSIYILDWILCLSLLMGLRIAVRLWRNYFRDSSGFIDEAEVKRVLIVGAGNLGEAILRMVDRSKI